MPQRHIIDTVTGEVSIEEVQLTQEELNARATAQAEAVARQQAKDAEKARRAADLTDVPANVNSVPALRDEVNKIKAILREITGA